MKANLDLNFFIFLIALMFSNCSHRHSRPYIDHINSIKFGEIHKVSIRLMMSVENIEKYSDYELINSISCLKNRETKKGRTVQIIECYRYFCYVDEVMDSDLLLRVVFKNEIFDENSKEVTVVKFENGKSIKRYKYTTTIDCNN